MFRSGLSLARDLVHLLRQTRDPPRSRVELEHALVHAASDLGLGGAQCALRRVRVAMRDGELDLLDVGANPARARAIDLGALGSLTDALLGGRMMGHDVPFGCFRTKRGV